MGVPFRCVPAVVSALFLTFAALPGAALAGGSPSCPNTILDTGEGCDDGNISTGDGCNSTCFIELGFACNANPAGLTGSASCESTLCNLNAGPTGTCVQPNQCGNGVCEPANDETCGNCEPDCGACTTTTTSTTTSTTALDPTTTTTNTTTTTTNSTTTTTDTSTTTTTMADPTGACCSKGCFDDLTEAECTGNFSGSWAGAGTTCDAGACSTCGNGLIELGEQCDDENTTSGAGDCCSSTCQYVSGGTSCADSTFCDGVETCDGSGSCNNGTPPDCSSFDSECTDGVCDEEVHCHALPIQNGQPCGGASGSCVVGGSGTCSNGVCAGTATALSPTCRWIIVGGSPQGDVRVRTGAGSTLDANTCGDTAKWGGKTSASMVSIAPTGEGARFYGPPLVDGDIVTGGSTVKSNIYLDVPGTMTKFVDTGMTMAKMPAGVIDTTGTHMLVDVCSDDQTAIAAAVPTIMAIGDAMLEDGAQFGGLRVKIGGSYTIDITGQGVTDYDVKGLKVGKNATLTLKGNATDVLVLRVDGRLKIGYGATVTLDGILPEHVLFYGYGTRCRVSPGATGSGTIFCPTARRFVIGVGSTWSGTFLGSAREVQVRVGAQLTHLPFTGF